MEVTKGMTFGAKISDAKAISTDELATTIAQSDNNKAEYKVSGEVVEVCQNEGCWLKLKTADGAMMVRMKDHAFLVPVSLVGRKVMVEGPAQVKEVSVAMLRHYAEDAGKSKAEIDAITKPSKEPVLQAKCLVVAD
ncbi:MAG: DUF4920 domain-containing protein [Chitinophagaceae bacterium]|nr:DUF4920 domain-containing protein [Bacteroidota bacterium]MCC6258004.1 DUF4920 domain-containing protein [Chitinophagaceae bacterium]MCW5917974.1 DUF4920 domain-containing protein [Ferruginibacter sp.]